VLVADSTVLTILNSFFNCLSQKRFAYVQANEPIALMFCITLNLIKKRMLLFKC